MPPIITRKCPRCGKWNSWDLVDLESSASAFYRAAGDYSEYKVKCKHCGHEFIIRVGSDERKISRGS